MARQTKVRIVGDPKIAMKVALCIGEHFEIERQEMYNRTPYRTKLSADGPTRGLTGGLKHSKRKG